MRLYKRSGSPFYYYEFELAGQSFRKSTGETQKLAAKSVADADYETAVVEQRDRLKRGDQKLPMEIGAAFSRWWDEVGKDRKDSPTLVSISEKLITFLTDALAERGQTPHLSNIDSNLLSKFVAWRKAQRVPIRKKTGIVPGKAVSPRTVNYSIQVLRAIMFRARDKWREDLPLMPDFDDCMLSEPKERVRRLSLAEYEAFVAEMGNDILDVFKFSILSGFRESEALLRKRAIDLELGIITTIGKGGKEITKPITPAMESILRGRWDHHPEVLFTYEAKRTGQGERRPITIPWLKSSWHHVRNRAAKKVPSVATFRWHDLRHTFATHLQSDSKDMRATQMALNHSSSKMTERYAHVLDSRVRDAMVAAEQNHYLPGLTGSVYNTQWRAVLASPYGYFLTDKQERIDNGTTGVVTEDGGKPVVTFDGRSDRLPIPADWLAKQELKAAG